MPISSMRAKKIRSPCVDIGATSVTEDDGTESLIKRADGLLYESKRLGRNRLSLG